MKVESRSSTTNFNKKWVNLIDSVVENHGSWDTRKGYKPWEILRLQMTKQKVLVKGPIITKRLWRTGSLCFTALRSREEEILMFILFLLIGAKQVG